MWGLWRVSRSKGKSKWRLEHLLTRPRPSSILSISISEMGPLRLRLFWYEKTDEIVRFGMQMDGLGVGFGFFFFFLSPGLASFCHSILWM